MTHRNKHRVLSHIGTTTAMQCALGSVYRVGLAVCEHIVNIVLLGVISAVVLGLVSVYTGWF